MNRKICSIVRDRILCLEYPPGHILSESVLAREFHTSRMPIREVLGRLEWEQLVRIIPRTGALVTEIQFEKMMQVFNIRLKLEELIGQLAAEHITDAHLHRIKEIQNRCTELLKTEDRKALMKSEAEFRNIIYDATNNPVLVNISRYLYNLTLRIWCTVFSRGNWVEEVKSFTSEVQRNHEVLSRRDPTKAGKLRQKILSDYIERIKNKF